jgi:CRISPR/Cas system-associated exonuclease Cas4 (RecB family)
MIYKFETEKKESDVIMELQRIENEISIIIGSDNHSVGIEIKLSKEKLYDLIGALHSIQGKMKGGYNGTR